MKSIKSIKSIIAGSAFVLGLGFATPAHALDQADKAQIAAIVAEALCQAKGSKCPKAAKAQAPKPSALIAKGADSDAKFEAIGLILDEQEGQLVEHGKKIASLNARVGRPARAAVAGTGLFVGTAPSAPPVTKAPPGAVPVVVNRPAGTSVPYVGPAPGAQGLRTPAQLGGK